MKRPCNLVSRPLWKALTGIYSSIATLPMGDNHKLFVTGVWWSQSYIQVRAVRIHGCNELSPTILQVFAVVPNASHWSCCDRQSRTFLSCLVDPKPNSLFWIPRKTIASKWRLGVTISLSLFPFPDCDFHRRLPDTRSHPQFTFPSRPRSFKLKQGRGEVVLEGWVIFTPSLPSSACKLTVVTGSCASSPYCDA